MLRLLYVIGAVLAECAPDTNLAPMSAPDVMEPRVDAAVEFLDAPVLGVYRLLRLECRHSRL